MKTEVYSWRVSSTLKSDLEREARQRKTSISSLIDAAVREWLTRAAARPDDEEQQRRLHAAAERYIGSLPGGNPSRSQTVRQTVRQRLARRRAS